MLPGRGPDPRFRSLQQACNSAAFFRAGYSLDRMPAGQACALSWLRGRSRAGAVVRDYLLLSWAAMVTARGDSRQEGVSMTSMIVALALSLSTGAAPAAPDAAPRSSALAAELNGLLKTAGLDAIAVA